jgi:hypothetical protein
MKTRKLNKEGMRTRRNGRIKLRKLNRKSNRIKRYRNKVS